ncbi:MAG: ribonuclease R, partial [Bacteroidota bacterium]|nr:ribonuclease R [Bacteroidota bacterium]
MSRKNSRKKAKESFGGKRKSKHGGRKEKRIYLTGTVDMTRMGYGYIISDEIEDDVFVAARNLNTALHGDKVKVWLYARKKGSRPEGEVVEILERWKSSFVGTLEVMPGFAFLIPDNKNMPFDIFIPASALKGGKQGQKAVARITEWKRNSKNPVGEIVTVLGEPGLHSTEMHAILAEYELPYAFTEEVEKDAASINGMITEKDIRERKDFRDVPT